MKVEDEPVVVEQRFSCTAAELWSAITNVDKMRVWYFAEIPEFEPQLDFEVQFSIESGGRDFLHLWTVTEVRPLSLIRYRWRYEGYSGDSIVTFLLCEEGAETTLKVSTEIREDFSEDIPEFARDSCVAGWNFLIKESLNGYLSQA